MERKPLQVLVVDDEPDMCWALGNILRPVGYEVLTTTSGKEALEVVARESCAVVLVDAKLPDLDGLELATLIRRQSPQTAMVLISGYFYQEDQTVTEGMQKDLFVGFVAKPFDLEEVRQMVCHAADLSRKDFSAKGGIYR